VTLDVAGVGYELIVPLGTMGRARKNEDVVTLVVHTHVREDQITLFGFASEDDRVAFRTLIGVSNVGPRTALAVLGAMPSGDLANAIARKDVGKLTSIPGIGKKTAERLVLELEGKLAAGGPMAVAPVVKPKRTSDPQSELLIGALTRMGYKPAEAERTAVALGDRVQNAPIADLVREALALLAK
jgi:Holliday junction DNA helicase RuvA